MWETTGLAKWAGTSSVLLTIIREVHKRYSLKMFYCFGLLIKAWNVWSPIFHVLYCMHMCKVCTYVIGMCSLYCYKLFVSLKLHFALVYALNHNGQWDLYIVPSSYDHMFTSLHSTSTSNLSSYKCYSYNHPSTSYQHWVHWYVGTNMFVLHTCTYIRKEYTDSVS